MKKTTPDTVHFMKALEILYPFKNQLDQIKNAEANGEFDTIEVTDSWSAVAYFRDSDAYKTYGVNQLAKEINHKVKSLDQIDYNIDTYLKIQKLRETNTSITYEDWTLSEVYIYLQMSFESSQDIMDEIAVENSIIRGEIFGIINCFLYRI